MARYMPGGRVVLSSGDFELSGPVQPYKEHSKLEGQGQSTLLRPHTTGFAHLIQWDETNSAHAPQHGSIESMELLTDGDDHYDLDAQQLIRMFGGWQTTIKDVHTRGGGFQLEQCDRCTVTECDLLSDAGTVYNYAGVYLLGDSTNSIHDFLNVVERCLFDQPGEQGMRAQWQSNLHVTGCEVWKASQADLNFYSCYRLMSDTVDSLIDDCEAGQPGAAEALHGINEHGARNFVVANRVDGTGSDGDVRIAGTDSVGAANHADGYVWYAGTQKGLAQAREGGENIWVQSTAPTAEYVGDLWIDSS